MLLDSKTYIYDDAGNVKSVVLDYKDYQRIEEVLLDQGLVKAMEEVEADEEVDLEEARRIIRGS